MQDNQNLQQLFSRVQNIAILGAKDSPEQPVHRVGQYLIKAGFTVFPVHPKRQNIWGLPTYQNLQQIPQYIDLVNLFRASDFCADHARETLQLEPRPLAFWMQQGVSSPEARAMLEPQGIKVFEDSCIMLMHKEITGRT